MAPPASTVSIVLVSHSRALAEAVAALARQMTGDTVAIACAAGIGPECAELGTDATAIADAITAVDGPDGIVVLMDLGSALLSADLALSLIDPDVAARVTLTPAPFVEGAVAAAVRAGAGAPRDEVADEARAALAPKAAQLGEAIDETAAAPAAAAEFDAAEEATIHDPAGLHARPAAQLVALASTFKAAVSVANVTRGTGPAAATSMVALASLGVRANDRLRITARGGDAAQAVAALRDLIAAFRGTGEALAPRTNAPTTSNRAIAVAPGVVLGPLYRLDRSLPPLPTHRAEDVADEVARLTRAVAAAKKAISAATRGGDILAIQLALLADPAIVDRAIERIETERDNAAAAWQRAIEEAARTYRELDDPYLKAREADVRDAGAAVLRALLGSTAAALPSAGPPVVLLADDLTPSEASRIDPAYVLGVIDQRGGPTSHAAILLRAAGIPAIAGAGALVPAAGGTLAAFDGATGEIWIDPDEATRATIAARQQSWQASRRTAAINGRIALADGQEIELWANVSGIADARAGRAAGAIGVGVVRTEMLFFDRRDAPTEAEQVATLRTIFEAFEGCPIIVRTLDAGGDKPLPYLVMPPEANPYLGVRGIRLSLEQPDIFELQLRAILVAGDGHDVRIMLPMIAALDELVQARAHLERAHAELAQRGVPHAWPVPLGIMVEVPAAALMAEQLAAEADFFSIGTNDLTQYALAAERGHAKLGDYTDAAHPAVLRLIRDVVEAGRAAGRPVSVCGEAAGDPEVAALLVGLGITKLSAGAASLAGVALALTGRRLETLQDMARLALEAPSAAAARAVLARR